MNMTQVIDAAQRGFAQQASELASTRAVQPLSIISQTATGSADMDATFSLDRAFRLVFVRCHFSGSSGKATMTIANDSGSGIAYDVELFQLMRVGTGGDVNFRLTEAEIREPSPWTFQSSDAVRIQWTNPDTGNIVWGLEVGLAIVS